MANKRISALDNLGATPAVGDILPITDIDDLTGSPQGTTKGVTFSDLTNHLATTASLGNHASLTSSVHGISAFGATLVDDADAPTARTTLGLGTAATTASTDYATSAQGGLADTAVQPAGIANMVETTDSIDVLSDVDTSTVAPTTNDLLKWDGTNFVPGTVPVDVDTPLTTALRGTDNPHIGVYPNQSFKVIDNPDKSVMVIADENGNLEFLVNSDSAKLFLNKPSLREEITTGVSVKEDSIEPDIEITTTSGTYSLITGDSDALGANGLPARQGFNVPDIGVNQAPLLISGGTIS